MSAGRPVEALVLRKYDYSETSQILRLLTRTEGVLGVLAKGAKKPKSSFGGPLDLFYRGPALVVFRRSGLHLLTSFAVADAGTALRAELTRTYAACHLSEILIGMTQEEEPNEDLYERVVSGLDALSGAGPEEVPSVLVAVEIGVLSDLGFAPGLSDCASCGRAAEGGSAALSAAKGGVVCGECRHLDPNAKPLPASVAGALRALARTPPARAGRIRLSPRDRRTIRSFLTAFEEWRLERALRTARFL